MSSYIFKDMKRYADIIFLAGGEGVMLRMPHSLYEYGKSRKVIKYKVRANLSSNSQSYATNNYGIENAGW